MSHEPQAPRWRLWRSLPLVAASIRATIRTKLLAVYLLIAVLLLSAAGVGLFALREMNFRAQESAQLQRKIAAYRQINHDIIAQLYGVSSALLQPEERRLQATLRQLKQFGYDLDRLQYLSHDEMATMERIRSEFESFIGVVTQVVALIRAGKVTEGQHLQSTVAAPLADRLERDTNYLVNKAEADMVAGIELANEVYSRSRQIVIICGVASVLLALGLGYVVSRSLIDPIQRMEAMMRQLATGDFARRVEVANRDELGLLAQDMNRTSEELGRLYDQLDAAREHAERANQAKSQFLAAASHDLRQPMHALALWVGNLQTAFQHGDRGEVQRAASAIDTACRSLSTSFSAILDLSQFDVQLSGVKLLDTDVSELCRRVAQEFEPDARNKHIELRVCVGAATAYGHTDEVVLGRILRNLVGNAVKFCESGGVLLGLSVGPDQLRIHVVDTGPGIAQAHWPDIFKEFYQVKRMGRDHEQGVGLGLSIVRKGVDRLPGHRLGFNSRVGHGSRFTVTLPRVHVHSGVPTMTPVVRSGKLAGAYVAVVEDEPLVLQGLVSWLRNQGCLTVFGESGALLLDQMRRNERFPDLLIADWRLASGETGADVARAINEEIGRDVPLIIMTGEPVEQLATAPTGLHASWMQKPVDATELITLMEAKLPVRQFV